MQRTPFRAPAAGGELVGWYAGDGAPVLAVHGGPGLSYDYLDPVVEDLAAGFRVATFQQRGLDPSTVSGPFTVAQAVADVAAVLDHLGWERAYLVGHSWGGHLAFHVAGDLGPRLIGVLAVDPLGAVGDGAMAAFEEEIYDRLPEDVRDRARALDEKGTAGESAEAEAVEAARLVWPGYFAATATAPAMPATRINPEASRELVADLGSRLPALESSLPDISVPVGVLVGGRSPMPPVQAGIATAQRIPGAWWLVEPEAGHFPWVERPGCVLAALQRLVTPPG